MLKIKSTAWHYRLYCFWHTVWDTSELPPITIWELIRGQRKLQRPTPTTLCRYFWFIVLSSVVLTLFSSILVLAGVICGPIILLVGVIGYGIKLLYYRVRRRRRFRRRPASIFDVLEKEPSLVVEFVKAKKKKVCPLLEVID